MKTFSLKVARLLAGYTQEDLAKKMNKSINTIIKWEKSNGDDMKIKEYVKLCEVLNIDLNSIFFYTSD